MNSKLDIHSHHNDVKLCLSKKTLAGNIPKWPWLYYDSDIVDDVFKFFVL